MAVTLDLADIQGNILAGYGKQGYPYGRILLLRIDGATAEARATAGRAFVEALRPYVTTALRWEDRKPVAAGEYVVPRPEVTLNIAFTYPGLVAAGVPTRTLRCMPDAFIDGMAKRARMLGDDFVGDKWREKWDEIWQDDEKGAHIFVMLNARFETREKMNELTLFVEEAARKSGVFVLDGHNPKGAAKRRHQELAALFRNGEPRRTEHFGFADGISDPVFEGQYTYGEAELQARGNGAVDGLGKWRPLATGEFLLGYPDEAQETSGPITPINFFRNGTFMAYRKLHQNVQSWRSFIRRAAEEFKDIAGLNSVDDAESVLIAKMIGRWQDGVPTSKAPTLDEWRKFNAEYRRKKDDLKKLKAENGDPAQIRELEKDIQLAYADFSFCDDPQGIKCPMTSHARRVNTRDSLDPRAGAQHLTLRGGSVLNNRRRILRRGLPYGDSDSNPADDGDHGIVMLVMCADLFRQFEFVQQQWINYGLDARAGSEGCPITGNHSQGNDEPDEVARKRNGPKARFVVPADPKGDRPPFIIEGIPQLVETRGGDYFFIPSLSALRMIAHGAVDPT